MKLIQTVFLFLFVTLLQGQEKDGKWDSMRATNETVALGAGKRKCIKTADFPAGTTEVAFRIYLLDDNQKISSSLVSVLKSIPDPTGISQGSAGAIFLASTISGDDKCKYAVFSNENDALEYESSGNTKKACFTQDNPVNKDAKLLSQSSKCVSNGMKNLWFGFESDNWVMNEKIVLEVVPWVNYKMSRGWGVDEKKEVVAICKGLDVMPKITKKDEFCGCFLDLVTTTYTYQDYKALLPEEKNSFVKKITEQALIKSGEYKNMSQLIREKAKTLFNNGKYQQAIDLVNDSLVKYNSSSVADYNLLAKFYLQTKQFYKALWILQDAEKMNGADLETQLNLAHAYLFTDEYKKAKEIHKKHMNRNVSAEVSWVQQTKADFTLFESKGLESKDFKRILNIFE